METKNVTTCVLWKNWIEQDLETNPNFCVTQPWKFNSCEVLIGFDGYMGCSPYSIVVRHVCDDQKHVQFVIEEWRRNKWQEGYFYEECTQPENMDQAITHYMKTLTANQVYTVDKNSTCSWLYKLRKSLDNIVLGRSPSKLRRCRRRRLQSRLHCRRHPCPSFTNKIRYM